LGVGTKGLLSIPSSSPAPGPRASPARPRWLTGGAAGRDRPPGAV